ncbi:unnamed protein product [Mytilus coruscus]|uniref:DZIP3-like HEPN domain-containing protein n=1 Tax=Mytilus coruscus TaxID=42192 RepID=A0A6J8BMS1_MYTCO|nr:unnamed protein product [Mytilus coruscus]
MSDIFQERHAKLGCMVLRLFPKVMQMILKDYITPKGLQKRFSKNDFRLGFTENEVVLMEKLPNIDDFTIEISYKILRFEFNMLDEPNCKWGNVPHDTEVEIADDIQRLINATNSLIKINTEEVTAQYSEKMLEEIKFMVTRIDSYLEQDDLRSLFTSLCRSETDYSSILQDLTRVKAIEESLPDTESENGERYSRVSMAIIETFPNVLRDVIQSMISASQLYQKCIPILKTFNAEQQKNITTLQHSNSYDSLDITLIYKLLRQFSLIPSPTKGWGSIPDKVDTNIGDDMERIRRYRNQVAHRSDTKINKTVFDKYFENFREIVKYEKKPIKVYWGDSFDRCLLNLRSLLKDDKLEGRQKVRVQIIFQNEDHVESNIEVLNSLKKEINEGLSGIELIIATKGSIVLHVDILLGVFETDEKLQTTLALFLEEILERITAITTETIDIVVLPVEENTECNKSKPMGEQVYLEFDMMAQLLETDDKMVKQLKIISDAIFKHSNRIGTNQNSTATLLHINRGN